MDDKEIIILEYDPEKNRRNIELRGLSFDLAKRIFADPNMKWEIDARRDYGEDRYAAYALVDGLKLRVCWTPRGNKKRIITLYQVHRKEWEEHYGKNDS